jgi:Ca2+-binding RTX toxin-like protein
MIMASIGLDGKIYLAENEYYIGTSGRDSVDGANGDLIDGSDGDDELFLGGSGTVFGGAGDDWIYSWGLSPRPAARATTGSRAATTATWPAATGMTTSKAAPSAP